MFPNIRDFSINVRLMVLAFFAVFILIASLLLTTGVKTTNERKAVLLETAIELKQTGVCAVSGIITEHELGYLIRASHTKVKRREDLFGYTFISLRPIELDFQPAGE